MQYKQLGSSPLQVSTACLGTMTFGQQNTQADANAQLDYATGRGVNFLDTAELYAIPTTKETYGDTERMIGHWLSQNPGKRKDLIIGTKIAGKGVDWIRGGDRILGKYVEAAVDASLERLQTDYIDLYQLHWPNRENPSFNRHWFGSVDFSTVDLEREEAEILAVLEALDKCVKAGKIRYCGLSNETAWGIAKYEQLAKENNLPQMVSLQNEFNLLHTKDWPMVIESCQHNKLAYLPWSPLATGALTGKYLDGQFPDGSRWTLNNRHGNFRNQPLVHEAVAAYKAIAEENSITVGQLSLAWCHQFDWITSTIIGATKMTQLKENLDAFDLELSEDTLAAILAVKQRFYMPYV